MDMVIVQWVAEVDATNVPSHSGVMLQHIDAVEAIVSAAARENLSVILGLEHDPNWWNEITAPPEVLRDYLLVRVSRQEILQKALLERFGAETHWTGYYIADEIDDRSWRDPARQTIRITSYNVCYTKLLRGSWFPAQVQDQQRCPPNL